MLGKVENFSTGKHSPWSFMYSVLIQVEEDEDDDGVMEIINYNDAIDWFEVVPTFVGLLQESPEYRPTNSKMDAIRAMAMKNLAKKREYEGLANPRPQKK